MPSVAVELSDAEAERLNQRARWAKTDGTAFARKLLVDALEVAAFPDGHLKETCAVLGEFLASLPGGKEWTWSGVQHRHWWVSVRFDSADALHTKVIRALAAFLNTDAVQAWGYKPFVFTPELGSGGETWWQIHTLVSMVDPAEVARYLRERLPESTEAWADFAPVL